MAKSTEASAAPQATPKIGAKAGRLLDELAKKNGVRKTDETRKKAIDIALGKADKLVRIEHVYEALGQEMPKGAKSAYAKGGGGAAALEKDGSGNARAAAAGATGAAAKKGGKSQGKSQGKTSGGSQPSTEPPVETATEQPPETENDDRSTLI